MSEDGRGAVMTGMITAEIRGRVLLPYAREHPPVDVRDRLSPPAIEARESSEIIRAGVRKGQERVERTREKGRGDKEMYCGPCDDGGPPVPPYGRSASAGNGRAVPNVAPPPTLPQHHFGGHPSGQAQAPPGGGALLAVGPGGEISPRHPAGGPRRAPLRPSAADGAGRPGRSAAA
ncbi:hypothetical protein THAOC_08170, partial [Thalassiosira oceanica]